MGLMKRSKIVINEADLLFEVIDARFPKQTRNKEIEKKN